MARQNKTITRSRTQSEKSVIESAMTNFEGAYAGYKATKKGRFNQHRKHIAPMGSSADYHIKSEFEYYQLIEDCYDLERNDSVVGMLLNRRVSNVIQNGFRLEPTTGDKGLNDALKARWLDWSKDAEQCDVSGEASFHDFEIATDWTHLLAGDCGLSVTSSGHLQFFEPYLIRNNQNRSNDSGNEIFLGVELDNNRRRNAYYIATDETDPNRSSTFSEFTRIDTRDQYGCRQFLHIYNNNRLAMTRGVSAFAPIFELTGMLEDVNFAKLVQQQIVSCIAFLINESEASSGLPATSGSYGGQTSATSATGETQLFDEVEPGMEVKPGPGKSVTGFSPQVPNPEYFQQYRLILQLICGNLDLPLSVGMMDSSETNFHGFIGAANEAKKLWRDSQSNLDNKFHKPVYTAKAFQFAEEDPAMARAMARVGEKNFVSHVWHKPVWQSVKPLDDTQDRLMRLRNAIISPSRMHAELNTDYEEHVAETIRDNAFAIESAKTEAIKINSKFADGQPVHWQQLYPMPTPDGMQATTQIEPPVEGEGEDIDQPELKQKQPVESPQQSPTDEAVANVWNRSIDLKRLTGTSN